MTRFSTLTLAALTLLSLSRASAFADELPTLVRDIDTTGAPYVPGCDFLCPPFAYYGSLPGQLLSLGNKLLFSANDRSNGFEAWISDGLKSRGPEDFLKDLASLEDEGDE